MCRRAFGFWLGIRIAFFLVGGSVVLHPSSYPIVIAATCFLAWIDTRVSGEDLLLANLGTSTTRIISTVAVAGCVFETIVYAVMRAM